MTPYSVPRLWPGSTVVCAGSGPTLTAQDLDLCRGRARVIVVNDAWKLAPWANALYAADERWWKNNDGVPAFAGMKFSIGTHRKPWPGVQCLMSKGAEGIETASDGLRTGHHSGYQAVNLAVHFGAKRILLLGYDMHGQHFFGRHKDNSVPGFVRGIAAFTTMVLPLKSLGVEVLNCTPGSRVTAFPRAKLADVLPEVLEAAV